MSDQNIQISIDTGNVDSQIKQFAGSINTNVKVLENMAARMVEFNQAGKASRAILQGVADDGRKIEANLKLAEGAVKKMTVTVRENAQALRDQAKAAKEAAAAQEAASRATAARGVDQSLRSKFPAPTGADFAQLARYEQALSRIRQLIQSGKTTQAEVNLISGAAAQGRVIPNLTPGGTQVQTILANLQKGFTTTGTAGADAALRVEQAWNRVQQAFIGIAIFNVLNRLTTAFINSTKEAADFQLRVAEIRTISQESQLTTSQWTAGLRQLSEQFGRPIGDVAAAQYQLISNQIAQGARSLEVMNSIATLAVTTNSSLEASVNAVSGAMNSFGISAGNAERVAATLFKTVELGRVQLPELQNTIGRVGGIASTIGISLEEVGAALSTLTIKGIRNNEATTLLTNILLKLEKPTAEMKRLFDELGVSSGQAAIATYGLGGFLQKMAQIVGNDQARFAAIGGELRSLKGFLSLASDGAANFEENLRKMEQASSSFQLAQSQFQNLPGQEFKKQMEEVANFFTVTVGQTILKSITTVTGALGGMAAVVKVILSAVVLGAAGWAAYKLAVLAVTSAQALQVASSAAQAAAVNGVAASVSRATAVMAAFRAATLAAVSAAGLLGLLAIGGTALFSAYTNRGPFQLSQNAEEGERLVREAQLRMSQDVQSGAESRTRITEQEARQQSQILNQHYAEANKLATESLTALKDQSRAVNDNLKISADFALEAVRSRLSEIRRQASEATSAVEKSKKSAADFQINSQNSLLDLRLNTEQNPVKQIELLREQINKLKNEAQTAFRAGKPEDIEEARKKFDEIRKLVLQIAQIEQQQQIHQAQAANPYGYGPTFIPIDLRNTEAEINSLIQERNRLEAEYQKRAAASAETARRAAVVETIKQKSIEKAVQDLTSFSIYDQNGNIQSRYRAPGDTREQSIQKALKDFDERTARARELLGPEAFQQLDAISGISRQRAILEREAEIAITQARGQEAQQRLQQTQQEYARELDAAREFIRQRQDILSGKNTEANRILTLLGEREGANRLTSPSLAAPQRAVTAAIEAAQQALQNLNAQGGQTPENIEKYEIAIRNLSRAYTELREAGKNAGASNIDLLTPAKGNQPATTITAALRELEEIGRRFSTSLNEIGDKKSRIAELEIAQQKLNEQIRESNKLLGEFNRLAAGGQAQGPAAQLGAEIVQSLTDAIRRLRELSQNSPTAPARPGTSANPLPAPPPKPPEVINGPASLPLIINRGPELIPPPRRDTGPNIVNGGAQVHSTGPTIINGPVSAPSIAPPAHNQTVAPPMSEPGARNTLLGFNDGGIIPGGGPNIDSRIAAVTPGEAIISRDNTQRFYPIVQSLIAGRQPTLAVGNEGPSVNVGDIHVVVQGNDSPRQTARDLANAVRREIRRGTISLSDLTGA